MFSKIFEKIGSNEMGRKSFIVFGDDIFGMWITMTELNISGKISWLMHLLNKFAKIGAITTLSILTNLEEIPSRPGEV